MKEEEIVGKESELADSDELKSIGSSSDRKGDSSSFLEFNELKDFSKPINLKLKMLFSSVNVFRKTLKQYAIE